jgi:hypothetical protein
MPSRLVGTWIALTHVGFIPILVGYEIWVPAGTLIIGAIIGFMFGSGADHLANGMMLAIGITLLLIHMRTVLADPDKDE